MQTNMLCAKNVKRHGMSSTKWTTKDKITQYKGLVNLYARDKKIFDFDTKKARKTLKQETFRLRKEIDHQREVLDNATFGDRQELRNTLSEHRNLQLAYQKTPPTKVIDVLYQKNFDKRKLLDRVNYTMKEKTAKLVKLKLEYAEYSDRIKYEALEKIPEEDQAQIITARVLDAILKNQIATDVSETYNKILVVLKKDAVFFDAVLATLQVDGFNQGKCILKVTEMGQLATEYLDDKKNEYGILENMVLKSMKERDISIKEVNEQLLALTNNVKYLIRRDSLVDLNRDNKSKHSNSEIELTNNICSITNILNMLRDTTVVANIPDIFPRMEGQLSQTTRLAELVAKTTNDRDILMNKSKHAEQVYYSLGHVMVSTTFWYKEEKVRLLTEIKECSEKRLENSCLIKNRGELFMTIRASLQQVAELLRLIPASTSGTGADTKKEKTKKKVVVSEVDDAKIKLTRPNAVEEDAMKLINLITVKLNILQKAATDQKLEPAKMEIAIGVFQKFVDGMIGKSHILIDGPKEESLLSYVALVDPQVPSRFDIKVMSAEICEKNAKSEFDV